MALTISTNGWEGIEFKNTGTMTTRIGYTTTNQLQWNCPECGYDKLCGPPVALQTKEWACDNLNCIATFGKKTIQILVGAMTEEDLMWIGGTVDSGGPCTCGKCYTCVKAAKAASKTSDECKCPIIGLGIVHIDGCKEAKK